MSEKPDKSQQTEKPTPKRRKDARKDGRVAKSPDVASWAVVLAATYAVPMGIAKGHEILSERFLTSTKSIMAEPSPEGAAGALGSGLGDVVLLLAPVFGLAMVVSVCLTLAQVGFLFTGKPLVPKFSKLNPLQGIKNLFSLKGVWEAIKSALKFGVIAAFAVPMVRGIVGEMVGARQFKLGDAIPFVGTTVLSMIRLVAIIGLGLAVADYAFQKWQLEKSLKMSKQELKMEHRNSEGDPMVKGRMRALAQGMSRNRMLASVVDANVVITNPTHYAVALRYEAGMAAPKVLAKGGDHLAMKIRERAREHGVPIVEAPPLARAIYAACDVNQYIPVTLFTAVARVLAFVHRLAGRVSLTGVHVMPDHLIDLSEHAAA